MPAKTKKQNKGSGGKNKRKNISPLFSDGTCTQVSDHAIVQTGSRNLENSNVEGSKPQQEPVVSNLSKRFHPSAPEYFVFNTPDMSFSQQSFPGSFMQSPPTQYTPQFMTTTVSGQPPPWATSIMEDIKIIKISVAKIENVEKTVNSISLKLNELETKVSSIDKRVVEVEKACTFVGEKYDQQQNDIMGVKGEVKKLQDSCVTLQGTINSVEKDWDRMNDKVLDNEFRSMRENLIFYGIPEAGNIQAERCDVAVKEFIEKNLKMDTSNLLFDRAHRLGNKISSKPRPIIVKFHYFHDREKVRSTAYNLRNELKNANLGVGVQLPKEWREARKKLYPVMQAEKRQGHSVKFVGEKLYVNGHLYKPPSGSTA